jgi:hypothetical protein
MQVNSVAAVVKACMRLRHLNESMRMRLLLAAAELKHAPAPSELKHALPAAPFAAGSL